MSAWGKFLPSITVPTGGWTFQVVSSTGTITAGPTLHPWSSTATLPAGTYESIIALVAGLCSTLDNDIYISSATGSITETGIVSLSLASSGYLGVIA